MEQIKFRITGTCPLMVHNPRMVNPFDPLARECKALTSKRKKTDEDMENIARISWHLAIYYDDELGPYLPCDHIEATISEAARMQKRGRDVIRGLRIIESKLPIQYNGPRDLKRLWNEGNSKYVDMRQAIVNRGRMMVCRPIFPEWALEFTVAYDNELLNRDNVESFIRDGGLYAGTGTYRQRFGRFDYIILKDKVAIAA